MDFKRQFGKLSEAYDSGRRMYSEECVDYIVGLFNEGTRVLDLGCGTGIATRQLAEKGLIVVGADSDGNMIEKAKEYQLPRVEYVVASADELPFQDGEFDAVSAFGAFHWFRDKKSIGEIKRVLNEEGVFVAVNKNDGDDFRRTYREVLKEFVADLPASVKRGYNPFSILKRNGFSKVRRKTFDVTEIFSIEEALVHVQSRGIWSYVPDVSKEEVVVELRKRISGLAVDGKIVRELETVVVHGEI